MVPPTMNYNQPPPPQQQYQGVAPPPPTANNAAVPTGKTPIARRTRSSKVNNNNTQKTATVGPPPQYNIAPPPPTNNNNTNTTQLPSTMYNPSLSGYESLNVNDAIAKRRAELRHLQQRQRDNGTLTNVARNKLSQGGNVRPTDYGVGINNITQQQGVGNNRLQQQPPSTNNNKPPPSTQNITNNKPASNLSMPLPPQTNDNNQTNTMQVPTPPIARRLDNSYGVEQQQQHRAPPQCQYPNQINPNNNNLANNSPNDNDDVPPMRSESYQEQRRSSSSTSSNRPGNQKRNSEIFTAGKKKLHHQVSSHTTQQFSSGSRENSSTTMTSGLTTEVSSRNTTSNQQQQKAVPKSPFGQARTILSVKQGDNPMLGVPPFQPPLIDTVDNDNEDENEDLLQNNIMPPSKKISPTASGSSVALKLGDRLVGEVDSGSSTPIMSNSFDEADTNNDFPTSNTQSITTATSSTTLNNNNDNNMSRLMSDLQRTEREKAEALEQVNKLRLLLATNNTTTANNEQQQPTSSTINNTTSSGNNITLPNTLSSSSELLNQFREMVTRQGASAAVDWMSKQLENSTPVCSATTTSGGLRSSPETPSRNNRPPLCSTRGASLNYAGGSELPLSSNIIPPLTPRSSSRPGSRAASPERGNVSTRGKRITTPLPKKLKVSNDSLDGMVSNNNGDFTSQQHQKGQQSDNNSPGIEQEYLTKASKCIPNEYGTMLASYIVRRPYITSTTSINTTSTTNNNNIEEEEFLQYNQLSSKSSYLNEATVLNPNTLEVVAYIEADNSILTLSGVSNVCHGYNNANTGGGGGGGNNGDWTTFDNVEENDVALGKVTYIDVDGNECDYWLDSIYEEALTTRESYCMSMISAAFALKEVTGGQQQGIGGAAMMSQQNVPVHQEYQQQPMMMQPPASPGRQQHQQYDQPPQMMMQAAPTQQQPMYQSMQQQPNYAQPPVGDMPPLSNQQDAPPLMNEGGNVAAQPPMSASSQQPPMSEKQPPSSEPTQQIKPKQQEQPTTTSTKKKLQPEEEYESADSALPYMIMSLFTLLLSIVTFVIKIPFRIGSTIFTFWVMIVVLRVLWLLLADDGGAFEIGAGVDYEYNMPGIY